MRKIEREAGRTEVMTSSQLGFELEMELKSKPSTLRRVKGRLFDKDVLPQERAFLFEHSVHMLTTDEAVRLMHAFLEEPQWVLTGIVLIVLSRDDFWNRLSNQQRDEIMSRLRKRVGQPFEGEAWYDLEEDFLRLEEERLSGPGWP